MTSQTSPRSSASESLSPQQAAATLSWSAAARPEAEDDERGPVEESESEEDDGAPAASEMTPELIRASAVAGLGGEQDSCSGVRTRLLTRSTRRFAVVRSLIPPHGITTEVTALKQLRSGPPLQRL